MKDCFGSFSFSFSFSFAEGFWFLSRVIWDDLTSKKVGCSFLRLVLLFLLSYSLFVLLELLLCESFYLLWKVIEPLGMFLAVLC